MKDELEDFLRMNRENADIKTPDPAVLNRILEQMQQKNRNKPKGILIPFGALHWAAACLIVVVCGIGFRALQKRSGNLTTIKASQSHRQQVINQVVDSITIASAGVIKNEQAKRNNTGSIEKDLTRHRKALLPQIKSRTLYPAKEAMYAGLNNMESPASRIDAAYNMYKLKNTGNGVVDALVGTLNTDPSANVRLAALDGLARFYRDNYVRQKLVTSLKKQQDPVVQITMINLLTGMRESGILEQLDTIVTDDTTIKAVKDCAYSSIFRLRSS